MNEYDDWAGLCEDCKRTVFTMAAHKCPECKTQETNSRFKRCATCAKKQNKCSFCDKKIN